MAGSLQVKPMLIAPSLLSADPLAIGAAIDSLHGDFDWLHIDVLDAHLMVEPGEDFLDMFLAAKPDYLTVHEEACRHLHRALAKIRESGVKAGVSLNPATPVELIEPVLPLVDLVLLMSVDPGFGGQSFIPEVTQKSVELCRLREARKLDFLIEMDGGLGPATIAQARRSGVDVAVMGNAVFAADDPAAAVARARELAAQA